MDKQYRKVLMWVLYGLLFLLVMLAQTTVLGRTRFWGVKLNLIPVTIVCIAMGTGHEAGGLFGLIAACVWYAAGAEDGSAAMVTFTLTGILAGYLCDSYLSVRFLPALALSLGALLLHEGALFCLRFYLGSADFSLIRWVFLTAVLSLTACPALYLLAKSIRKVGGTA